MALERFIAEHVVISATLRGVNAERMTALEIHLGCMRFEVALATHVVEAAETEDNFNGTYTDLIAILEAIGEKFGVDYNDGISGAEAVEYMDDGEIFERANELLAV